MPYQYYENQYLEGQIMQNRSQIAGNQFAQGYVQQPTQVRQGQVNNYVNNTASVGTTQAVENVNYYDTYHHRINNYHTMNTNRYRDHYIDHNVYGTTPLFSFGDSIKKIFTLATAMISAKGGILLVDEIESAIHKTHINKVFDSIIKICNEYKVQLICTTHSLEAIDGIILSLGNQIDLLSCFRIEVYNNKTYYTKFSGDRLKDIRNLLGQDVR